MLTETIYVDNLTHCHRTDDGTMTAVQTGFFYGKCDTWVEGYCYDTSKGYEQIYPWQPMSVLEAAQRTYERQRLADAENALAILLGGETA